MRVSPLRESDASSLLPAWNANLPHDQVSPQRLLSLVFGDPNYEPEGMVLAEDGEGTVLGFAGAVLRRDVAGKDGGGREDEFPRGYLKIFFVADGADDAAAALLERAEGYCRAAGKHEMMVTEYSGPYLYPGMDVRYERLRGILVSCGYRDIYTIEDVAADLRGSRFQEMLEQTWGQMPSDVTVVTWEPGQLAAMRPFVAEGNMPQWFRAGWESGYQTAMDDTLVLRKGDEVLGWAHYWPGVPRAGFGPILVLPRARGNDYGALLLLECMVRAREGGSETMEAGWANTGFYVRHGWHITRRFAVLQKELKR